MVKNLSCIEAGENLPTGYGNIRVGWTALARLLANFTSQALVETHLNTRERACSIRIINSQGLGLCKELTNTSIFTLVTSKGGMNRGVLICRPSQSVESSVGSAFELFGFCAGLYLERGENLGEDVGLDHHLRQVDAVLRDLSQARADLHQNSSGTESSPESSPERDRSVERNGPESTQPSLRTWHIQGIARGRVSQDCTFSRPILGPGPAMFETARLFFFFSWTVK